MKIILTGDVKGLGSKGDVLEVKDGYANNYLLPNGLAVRATQGRLTEVTQVKGARVRRETREIETLKEMAETITSLDLELDAKAGPEGRLFGAITAKDISELIKEKSGLDIDRKKIHLDEPIKTSGFHEAHLKLHPEVEAVVHLKVIPKD